MKKNQFSLPQSLVTFQCVWQREVGRGRESDNEKNGVSSAGSLIFNLFFESQTIL